MRRDVLSYMEVRRDRERAPTPGRRIGSHAHREQEISRNEFIKVELRVGRIVSAEKFARARKPAYILHVDFGTEIGIKKSSAQITHLYQAQELTGKLVVAVVNFPKKQIGSLMSECLVTGFHNEQGEVVLCVPDQPVPPGAKLL